MFNGKFVISTHITLQEKNKNKNISTQRPNSIAHNNKCYSLKD